jgi:hypothetical protein
MIKAGEFAEGSDYTEEFKKAVDPAKAYEYFGMEAKVLRLKSMFYWGIGERFSCHDHKLGVRSRRRIIKGERKW